jgi:hypothetical protein
MQYSIFAATVYLLFYKTGSTSLDLNVFIILFYGIFVICRIYFLNEEKTSHPFFLRFFVLTPANNRNFFWKEGVMINYLLNKKSFLFFLKNLMNFWRNLTGTSRINPYQIFLWRPLIKRWSYFGLYVHSRAGFLKFFKNRNVK